MALELVVFQFRQLLGIGKQLNVRRVLLDEKLLLGCVLFALEEHDRRSNGEAP